MSKSDFQCVFDIVCNGLQCVGSSVVECDDKSVFVDINGHTVKITVECA